MNNLPHTNGYWANRHQINARKELWTVFAHQDHFSFFRNFVNYFIEHDDIDASLYTAPPMQLPGTINPLPRLIEATDILLIDASFLLQQLENSRGFESYWVSELLRLLAKLRCWETSTLFYATPSDVVELLTILENHKIQNLDMIMKARAFHVDFGRRPGEDPNNTLYHRFRELKSTARRTRFFLCHAHEDKPFVATLAQRLDNEGMYVCYDSWELNVGDSIVERVNQGISDCR